MFSYRKFPIEIVRQIDVKKLSWPARGEAMDEGTLGGNRAYMDLRGASWADARQTSEDETQLIARLENADDPEAEYEAIEEKIFESFYPLDLGLASTILALSAAKCIPFSSCNAGAFGGQHAEHYPVVAFYARPAVAELILTCAEEIGVGLNMTDTGALITYADDIRSMRAFGAKLIEYAPRFDALPRYRKPRRSAPG